MSGLILISRALSQGKESEGSELVRERKLLCNFEGARSKLKESKYPGDDSEGVTPVPIPNTEVKPFSADNTCWSFAGKIGHCQDCSSIAQSVERMTVNHDVTGSSPVRGASETSVMLVSFSLPVFHSIFLLEIDFSFMVFLSKNRI